MHLAPPRTGPGRMRVQRPRKEGGLGEAEGPQTGVIIRKLRAAEAQLAVGASVAEACRELEVSEATYHRWHRRYGAVNEDHVKRLRTLEKEGEQKLRTSSPSNFWGALQIVSNSRQSRAHGRPLVERSVDRAIRLRGMCASPGGASDQSMSVWGVGQRRARIITPMHESVSATCGDRGGWWSVRAISRTSGSRVTAEPESEVPSVIIGDRASKDPNLLVICDSRPNNWLHLSSVPYVRDLLIKNERVCRGRYVARGCSNPVTRGTDRPRRSGRCGLR